MSDMADLVRDDAGELVGAARFRDQPFEDVNVPARQCNRVGLAPPHNAGFERNRQPGRGFKPPDQRIERGAAGLFGVRAATFERLAGALVVEHGADLGVDAVAEAVLDRQRDQRRNAVGQQRHAEDRDQHQRHRGGERPADHALRAAAVRSCRSGRGCRQRSSISAIRPGREFRAGPAPARRRGEAASRHRAPAATAARRRATPRSVSVGPQDAQRVWRRLDRDGVARAGRAVEIEAGARSPSEAAHVERVGEALADGRAWAALGLDRVERGMPLKRESFHAAPP